MAKLKQEYIAQQWRQWLQTQSLNTFDAWWQLTLDAVDGGNYDRGGWSTVSRFERGGKAFYVKRQSNHCCINFASFPFKVPTFKAEFTKIGWYQKAGVPCLEAVYFAWRKKYGEHQAVLVTEALDKYQSLEDIISARQNMPFSEKLALSTEIGKAIGRLHNAGYEHHNLYPKHIFARRKENSWKIRFIDLESSRPHFGSMRRKLRELETLSRRAIKVNKSDKLRALLAYLNKQHVDESVRKYVQAINRRTLDKLARD